MIDSADCSSAPTANFWSVEKTGNLLWKVRKKDKIGLIRMDAYRFHMHTPSMSSTSLSFYDNGRSVYVLQNIQLALEKHYMQL